MNSWVVIQDTGHNIGILLPITFLPLNNNSLHGVAGLISEVHKDIKRLSTRNLGRDDRYAHTIFIVTLLFWVSDRMYYMVMFQVMSHMPFRCIGDHHREGRFPYLDESVVNFLNSLPLQDKVYYYSKIEGKRNRK